MPSASLQVRPADTIRLMQILVVSDLHYTLKQLDWVLSVAAEYDYLDMGSKTDTFGNFVGPFQCTATCQDRITQQIHLVTARLNYRFWTGR